MRIGIKCKGNVIQYFVTKVCDIISIILTKNQIPCEADDELAAKFVIRNLQSAISYLNILVN